MARAKGSPKPAGSGRKKGTVNKASQEMRELIEKETGGEPIPVLLARIGMREMRADGDIPVAIKALEAAAKYGYQALRAVEHSGKIDTGPQLIVVKPGECPDD